MSQLADQHTREAGPAHGTGATFAGSAHTRLFSRSLIRVEASDPKELLAGFLLRG